MTTFVHELISISAKECPEAIALQIKDRQVSYEQLHQGVINTAHGLSSIGISTGDRVGVYLAKNQQNVESMFACSILSAVFVPINPVLKPNQVQYIANDCQIKVLVTNHARLTALTPLLTSLEHLNTIIVIDGKNNGDNADSDKEKITLSATKSIKIVHWDTLASVNKSHETLIHSSKSVNDLAAILYTSGSTGQPKGIMLTHNNIVLGAKSVNQYLQLTEKDTILAVLPLSFDYGLNQLTSCFLAKGKCVLLDYLLANDVIRAIERYKVTGIAAVPPLWVQLTKAKWPDGAADSIRYFTNSGGALALTTLETLQQKMPQASPFLMYGLTEAFRSTYLSPEQVKNRPGSMGKAIPNSEILVLRADGSSCDDNEIGELVHIGPLVTLGYWQNTEATAQRFKATPRQAKNSQNIPKAVFSGDYVKRDSEGFLYFVGRKDTMIKTSGYRISPNELESVLLQIPEIEEAAVIGTPSTELGQTITLFVVPSISENGSVLQAQLEKLIVKHCQLNLPNYMMPKSIRFLSSFPRSANGKIDIKQLAIDYNEENKTEESNSNRVGTTKTNKG